MDIINICAENTIQSTNNYKLNMFKKTKNCYLA